MQDIGFGRLLLCVTLIVNLISFSPHSRQCVSNFNLKNIYYFNVSSMSGSSTDSLAVIPNSADMKTSLALQARCLMLQSNSQSVTSLQSEFNITSQPRTQSHLCRTSIPFVGEGHPLEANNGGSVYQCIVTLRSHGGCVFSLAMAGNLLYSGSSGNAIRVWRHPELNDHCKFGHGDGVVKCILVSGNRIYSGHQDHRIRVWKRAENMKSSGHKLVTTIPTLKDYVMNTIQSNKYVQVRRHKKVLWIEHVDTISALSIDRNGFLYSASWDRTVKIWRPSDFRCVESFRAHDDAINALVVSPDGFVYTGSADSRIKIWLNAARERKHSLVATLERHNSGGINALALSSDGAVLYSGACDRCIVVWERDWSAQHMVVSSTLSGHRGQILCLATAADYLCSGSADKSIRVWKRREGSGHHCLAVLEGHRGPVKSIAMSADAVMGCLVYSGALDQDIRVWQVSSNTSCSDARRERGCLLQSQSS